MALLRTLKGKDLINQTEKMAVREYSKVLMQEADNLNKSLGVDIKQPEIKEVELPEREVIFKKSSSFSNYGKGKRGASYDAVTHIRRDVGPTSAKKQAQLHQNGTRQRLV
ncbi:hypothetical protein BFP72_08480 [Reichenbachiella sp. 5M10]|uniref:hypothetical protein n=1 Tax=Reichenbachiella sp. 5M10 TaxID=1889772 RepID=UPI000C4D6AFF|nr:hypothetical protein [Reichenbachiella sp. 5M10]PIB35428.1 hypothetical protein BFP72_08480 [Reichenbachiella sp. 5M10]